MVVQDIIDLINEQTRDESITWTEPDVMQYINEGVKNTIQRAPQANSKKEFITASAGIEQFLPPEAVNLINVIANATVDNKLGDIIHKTDVVSKDAFSPGWRSSRAKTNAIEWMKRSEPTLFLVWPPLAETTQLYVEFSFYPPDVTLAGDTIVISNEYLEPIRNWCLYRTYSRDSEDTPSIKRAEGYKAQYEQFFGSAA